MPFIYPDGPRRSCHRSFGAYASLSRIVQHLAISIESTQLLLSQSRKSGFMDISPLLTEPSSRWAHRVQLRCKRRPEYSRLSGFPFVAQMAAILGVRQDSNLHDCAHLICIFLDRDSLSVSSYGGYIHRTQYSYKP